MFVDVFVPRADESQSDFVQRFPHKPALVPREREVIRSPSPDRTIGMLGLAVVGAIIGLSVYSVVRYLF